MEKEQEKYKLNLSAANEAVAEYVRKIDTAEQFTSLPEETAFTNFFEDKMLVIYTIRHGLTYELFDQIKSITPFTESDWAEFLEVSPKTLQRYSKDPKHLFKSIHTEKILEIAEVTHIGGQVFDSPEQFHLWLKTPCYSLNNLKPIELLKDSYGKELIMEELNRIEHGIFA